MHKRLLSRDAARGLLPFALILACLSVLPHNAQGQSVSVSPLRMLANRVTTSLKVSFVYSPKYLTAGQTVQFTGISSSTVTSWRWDFGDGATSTEQNPVHVYIAPGFRKVALVVSNSSSSNPEHPARSLTCDFFL